MHSKRLKQSAQLLLLLFFLLVPVACIRLSCGWFVPIGHVEAKTKEKPKLVKEKPDKTSPIETPTKEGTGQ